LIYIYSLSKFENDPVIFAFPDRRLPENPFKSRECKLKNLRVGILKLIFMKKVWLLITLVYFLSYGAAQAQLDKGNIMVGVASTLNLGGYGSDLMSIGFSSSKYKTDNYMSDPYKSVCFNLMPKAGFFVMDNLAAGLNIFMSISSEKDTGDDEKDTESLLGLGPWVRYYYPLEKIYPFVELNLGFGSRKYTWGYSGGSEVEKYTAFIFGGGIGAAIPLGEMVSFDVMAGYGSVRSKEKDSGSEVDYTEVVGTVGITMGFTVYLGPK